MNRIDLPLGVLFSSTGPYRHISQTQRNGALLGCAEVNADPESGVRFLPVTLDPRGDPAAYATAAQTMLKQGVQHIVGCHTSSSRKEVIPIVERMGGLLWYPTHYEGFEHSTNVIYTGASPNHHLSPLIDFLWSRFGQKVYCIGSNYVWSWESNRVLREEILRRKGEVLGERYYIVGDTELGVSIAEILETGPDFVFCSLIGDSAYAFYRAFRRACQERGIDQKVRYPIATCNLSEPELMEIGAGAADGHISSSTYFSTLPGATNAHFVRAYRERFPDSPLVCSEAESAYNAVNLLARAVWAAGSAEVATIRNLVPKLWFDAPSGRIIIDSGSHHARLWPRIGLSRADFRFDVLVEASSPVSPDPYLTHSASPVEVPSAQTEKRVESSGRPRLVQNFCGRRALIFHSVQTSQIDALPPTLAKLGLKVDIQTGNSDALLLLPQDLDPDQDILFVDGDNAFPSGWEWNSLPPAPVIGLVGIEAPSRLKALLQFGATAFLSKPVYGGRVFSALSLAINSYNQKKALLETANDLTLKRRKRGFVIKAVLSLMRERRLNDDAAYEILRKESMRNRVCIEDYSEKLVSCLKRDAQAPRVPGRRDLSCAVTADLRQG